jgi:hypothetical protein
MIDCHYCQARKELFVIADQTEKGLALVSMIDRRAQVELGMRCDLMWM